MTPDSSTRTLDGIVLGALRRHPRNLALVFRRRSWTYRNLIEKACGLSRRLAENFGVRRGDRVALYLDRSPEAVIGIYAALLSGASCVPIDPEAPLLRLRSILGDCRPKALITDSRRTTRFGGGSFPARLPCVFLDRETPPSREPRRDRGRDAGAAPGDPAYILYTSGSTGRPKGIVLTHANAAFFVRWAVDAFRLRARDRIGNLAPFHFDLSIFDLFASCAAGASLHPIPYPDILFPTSIAEFLVERRIAVLYTVPSVLSSLRSRLRLKRGAFGALRLVLSAGEVLPEATLRAWLDYAPRAAFYNLYGPTETNVCLFHPIPRRRTPNLPSIPIGKPLPGIQALVMGAGRRPAVAGAKGELWIAGPSVMKGYVGGRGMNRKAFRRIRPRGAPMTSRFYRTGDVVSRGRDGNYYFWGRRDDQVKIQGFRVELKEIERTLLSHGGVAAAAAVAVRNPGEELRIAAFVSPRRGRAGVSEDELRRHLAAALPPYMLPSRIRCLERLPSLSTGKVDRLALTQGFLNGS